MNDGEFLRALESGDLPPADFKHEAQLESPVARRVFLLPRPLESRSA